MFFPQAHPPAQLRALDTGSDSRVVLCSSNTAPLSCWDAKLSLFPVSVCAPASNLAFFSVIVLPSFYPQVWQERYFQSLKKTGPKPEPFAVVAESMGFF